MGSDSRIAVAPRSSFEEFYAERAHDLALHVAQVLRETTGSNPRVAVADALQEGMLRVYREWPQIEARDEHERARFVYRTLRLATLDLVRRESGRGGERRISYPLDFQALEGDLDAVEGRDRELAVAVLGRMARANADSTADYGTLVGGLAALSEREAVVFTAVEGLGWEQTALAGQLGMELPRLYETLHDARKLFYTFVRHAHGIELDDEERARLHAFQDGRLSARERRLTRRHLRHCERCQAYMRETRRFATDAHRVLAGLPFVFGAHVLVKKQVVKAAGVMAASAKGASKTLLSQPGAAKALAVTVGLLGLGTGVGAWLSIEHAPRTSPPLSGGPHRSAIAPASEPKLASRTTTTSRANPPARSKKKEKKKRSASRKSMSQSKKSSQSTAPSVQSSTPPVQPTSTPSATPTPSTDSSTGSDATGGSSGGGDSSSGGDAGGEFFGG